MIADERVEAGEFGADEDVDGDGCDDGALHGEFLFAHPDGEPAEETDGADDGDEGLYGDGGTDARCGRGCPPRCRGGCPDDHGDAGDDEYGVDDAGAGR